MYVLWTTFMRLLIYLNENEKWQCCLISFLLNTVREIAAAKLTDLIKYVAVSVVVYVMRRFTPYTTTTTWQNLRPKTESVCHSVFPMFVFHFFGYMPMAVVAESAKATEAPPWPPEPLIRHGSPSLLIHHGLTSLPDPPPPPHLYCYGTGRGVQEGGWSVTCMLPFNSCFSLFDLVPVLI